MYTYPWNDQQINETTSTFVRETGSTLLQMYRKSADIFYAFHFLSDKPEAVLDIGCGACSFLNTIKEDYPECTCVGINKHAGQSVYARSDVAVLIGEAEALPCDDNTFDAVYMQYTMGHIVNPDNALLEAHRVTKPGGHFVYWDIVKRGQANELLGYQLFDPRYVLGAITGAGFHVTDVKFPKRKFRKEFKYITSKADREHIREAATPMFVLGVKHG